MSRGRDSIKQEAPLMIDIVFDGQCGFCVHALTRLRRMARRNVFRLHDANDREAVLARFPMLEGAALDEAVFAIAPRGDVFRGFFAFRRMLWASPWLFPLLVLFYAPGASLLGPRIYAWVSRRRRSLGCAAAACKVPTPPRPPGP
jgi:predicted DCC family thiol-disulfide oxidoreductase YuxK